MLIYLAAAGRLGSVMIKLPNAGRVLLDHWFDVKKNEPVPPRRRIWPGAFRPILSCVVMLEWTGARQLIFRLAGTDVVRRFGVELRGLNLFDLLPDPDPLPEPHMLSVACEYPCGAFCELSYSDRHETPAICQMVYLPLADDAGVRTRMIGTITARNQECDPCDAPVLIRALRYERVSYLDLGAGLPG